MTDRYAEIDGIKVVGIFAVLMIHCLRAPWDHAISDMELFLNQELRFAVPGFLFCSGFLYAKTRAWDWQLTRGRLERILVPYFVASICAEIFRGFQFEFRPVEVVALNLLTGNSFGHYYYVFVIVGLVVATPWFATLGKRGLLSLLGITMLFQVLTIVGQTLQWDVGIELESNFWPFRSPLLWWNFFLLGWMARQHEASLRAFVVERRGAVASALGLVACALAGSWFVESQPLIQQLGAWLQIFCVVALIGTLFTGRTITSPLFAKISDATYAMYLFHLFFLFVVQSFLPYPEGEFAPHLILARFVPTLIGVFLFIQFAKRSLGPHSRFWLGA